MRDDSHAALNYRADQLQRITSHMMRVRSDLRTLRSAAQAAEDVGGVTFGGIGDFREWHFTDEQTGSTFALATGKLPTVEEIAEGVAAVRARFAQDAAAL